ncbi:MAG: TRAP transporter large permease [Eubacteriales bacterium]
MVILTGLILFVALLAILLIGVPVAFSLSFVAIASILILGGGFDALGLVASTAWSSVASFILTAVPLFVLMGAIISASGMGSRLYNALATIMHGIPGGLAVATTVACGVMAAVSGSSVATAGAIGKFAVNEMRRHGYNESGACGSVAAGGTLGIIIPPSIPMIIYGTVAQQSIGKLFIAGVIPGIILTAAFALFQVNQALRGKLVNVRTVNNSRTVSFRDRMRALIDVLPMALLILIILGSIYRGIATPTEAAALGTVASLIISGLLYRELNWNKMLEIFRETARSTVMVLMIIVGAMLFGYALTTSDVAPVISQTVASLPVSPWLILIAINILLIFLGCFMETISIIVITTPIFAPIISSLGWDLIWFGIILTINMEMALITPPVGLNLYVVQGVVKDIPLGKIISGTMPYVVLMAAAIALVAIFPSLALWLPSMMR